MMKKYFFLIILTTIFLTGSIYFLLDGSVAGASYKEVKILPTFFSRTPEPGGYGTAWQNPEAVFSHDLKDNAGFEEFNQENSAYVLFEGNATSTQEAVLEFSNFDIPHNAENEIIKSVQLKLSLAGRGQLDDDKLSIEYYYQNFWQPLADIILAQEISNATNDGYWFYNLSVFSSWDELKNLKIRFICRTEEAEVYLDALWLSVVYQEETIIVSEPTSDPLPLAVPSFTVHPHEDPACHNGSGTAGTSGNPINYGGTLTLKATAVDIMGHGWYLAICKEEGILPSPMGYAPTCTGAGGAWVVSSSSSPSGQEITEQFTFFSLSAAEEFAWYGYACDDYGLGSTCTAMSNGGTSGNNGSPFYVNHQPTFTAYQDDSPKDPDQTVTWTTTSEDSDSNGGDDTVTLYVCTTNDWSSGGSPPCAVGTWCHDLSPGVANSSCSYDIPDVYPDDEYESWGFIVDNHGFASTGDSQGTNSIMEVNNVAPSISAEGIELYDTDGGGNLELKVEKGETLDFYAGFVVSDNNSCEKLAGGNEIASAIIHAYRSGIGQANCHGEVPGANNNNCYVNAHTGNGGQCFQDESINSCTGTTDPTVGWKCEFPMQYHADPTVTATQYPSENWLVSVTATDDDWASTGSIEGTLGNEMDISAFYDVAPATIAYGSLDPEDVSADKTNTVEATGNAGLDVRLAGTSMTNGGSAIAVGQQKYAASDLGGWTGVALSGISAELELNVKKTTVTATPASADIHWRLKIPEEQTAAIYSGTNTIAGIAGEPAQWSWDYRKKLTINQDSAQSSTLDNFPLLVKIASSDTDFWSHVRNDGYDVLFVDADDSTFLDFHFEKFDHDTDDMVAWVEVPEIAAYGTTDYIYLYYGNSSADTDPQDEEGTYDTDTHFKMVQHLQETSKTAGTYNDHLDSTLNNNDGEAEMEEAHMDATGRIDGADDFDGTDDRVDCGNDLGLSSTALTVEVWVKYDSWGVAGKSRAYVGDWNTWSPGEQKGFLLRTYQDARLAHFLVGDGTDYHTVYYWTNLNLGEWYYIVGVFQANTTFKIYVNSAESSDTAPSQYVAETATPVYIGYSAINTGWFDGILDEVRISDTPRSAQWIKASYLNQKESSTYITYGPEEPL